MACGGYLLSISSLNPECGEVRGCGWSLLLPHREPALHLLQRCCLHQLQWGDTATLQEEQWVDLTHHFELPRLTCLAFYYGAVPPIKDPPRKGTSLQKTLFSHSSSTLTSNKRTTSYRTKWLIPKCPLFRGSTIASNYS